MLLKGRKYNGSKAARDAGKRDRSAPGGLGKGWLVLISGLPTPANDKKYNDTII